MVTGIKVVYYAKLENGDILESDSFREIYDRVKHCVKSDCHYSLYYSYLSCIIYYGIILEEKNPESKYPVCTHIPYKTCCWIHASAIEGKVVNFTVERI